jgi:ABC-type sugar transport system substrate-binding protein
MFKQRRIWAFITLMIVAMMVLAACGGQEEEPTEAPAAAPTEAPAEEPTEEPMEEPTEEPMEEPTEEPMEEPTEEPMEEPTEEPMEEPDVVTTEGSMGEAREMIFITHDMHPFFVPTIVGMSDACLAVGWECSFVGPPSFSVEGTLERIESSIAAGPDAIGMVFSDPEAYNELAQDAIDQGIVVVGYNTDNDFRAEAGLGYVGQDQFNAGYQNGLQAAKWAQEVTGRDDGKIVVMTCCPGHTALEERIRGTVAAIEETSNYTTEVLNGTDDAEQYVANVEAKYQAESDDIVGFAGVSGYTENLGRFAEANSLGGVVALGGFDLLPTTMASIEAGDMQWTIGQDPYTQGFMPVLMAWKQIERGYPGVFYDTGAEIIDPDNIADTISREQNWVDRTPELGLQG